MQAVRATVPASSANLGPGFDAMAVALDFHLTVTVSEAEELTVTSAGEGSHLPCDCNHLAARIATEVAGHDRLAIHIDSEIPLARGLGSSAALAVAAAAAAGSKDPLRWGLRVDGHAENAAASLYGGLVGATVVGGDPVAVSLPLDPVLQFVVVVPDRHLPTAEARAALPQQVPLADAAFNLGHCAVLIGALANAELLRPDMFMDRLHQDARTTALFPEARALVDGLVAAGALGAAWSGAGPTIVAVTDYRRGAEVRAAGDLLLAQSKLHGSAMLVAADHRGLVVEEM